uniref:Uncharacterized protein n=1 Tax=Marseillevirus LCMAC102 TaxID=2506603 RepID=A0A481YUD6_9VIRU|nr:MAG: hypothetical protein LCMAC102_01800 [Marseillevirus LCMAC102]
MTTQDWGIPVNPGVYHVKGDVTISTHINRQPEFLYTTEPLYCIHMVLNNNIYPYPSVIKLMTDIPGVWPDSWAESDPAQTTGYCYTKDVNKVMHILEFNGIDVNYTDIEGLDHSNDRSSLIVANTQETQDGIMAGFGEMITQSIDVISIDYDIGDKYLQLKGPPRGDAYLINDDDTYTRPFRIDTYCSYRLTNGKFSTLLYADEKIRQKLENIVYPS